MTDALDQEITAFEQLKPSLIEHHLGKYVVIKNGQLQGSFDSFNNAAEESVKRFGKGPFLIRQVGNRPAPIPASVAYRVIHAIR